MSPVIQEEISGCGFAACAVLAGITYAQANVTANHLGTYAEDTAFWSDTEYVRSYEPAFGSCWAMPLLNPALSSRSVKMSIL